jgi:hypothetical protein
MPPGGTDWFQANSPSGSGGQIPPGPITADMIPAIWSQANPGKTIQQSDIDYWTQKLPELNARGAELGNPNYAYERLTGTGAGSAAAMGSSAPGGMPGALTNNPGYGIFQKLAGGLSPQQILENDPGYQFRLQQGLDAISKSAAAKGTLLNAGTGKALSRYGQDYAAGEYGNVFNRMLGLGGFGSGLQNQAYNQLMGVSNLGLGAAGGQNAAGSAYAGNVGNLLGQMGNAQSAGTVGSSNAWQNALNQGGNLAQWLLSLKAGQPTATPPGSAYNQATAEG